MDHRLRHKVETLKYCAQCTDVSSFQRHYAFNTKWYVGLICCRNCRICRRNCRGSGQEYDNAERVGAPFFTQKSSAGGGDALTWPGAEGYRCSCRENVTVLTLICCPAAPARPWMWP